MKLGYSIAPKKNIFSISNVKRKLNKYGAEKIYIDYKKQKEKRREQLILAIKEAKKGDTIIIPKLEMIGYKLSTLDKFLKIAEKKEVHLHFAGELEIRNEIDLRVFIKFTRLHEEMFMNYKNGTIHNEYDEDYMDYFYDYKY